MNQKIIIFFIIIFLIGSFIFLAYVEKNQHINSDWWSLAFSDPKGSSLNFVIENHFSNSQKMKWEIYADRIMLESNEIVIEKNANFSISPDIQSNFSNKKITIKVTRVNESKEIYKYLDKI